MMTIGEKIRYFRQRRGITQSQLAQLANIHPVSIRKYETNKMQPQSAQIERIADALWVNPSALDSTCGSTIRLKTRGDMFSLLITWYKSGLLQVEGPREENSLISVENAQLKLHPVFSMYFQLQNDTDQTHNVIRLKDCRISIIDPEVLELFLEWEKNYYTSKLMREKYGNDDRPIVQDKLQEMEVMQEFVEMEMQANTMPLSLFKD